MLLGLPVEEIQERIEGGKLNIAVYGLGRVGLPIAAAWLRARQKVIGADISREVVNKINRGISPILDEPHIPEAVEKFVKEGKFKASTDLIKASEESEVKIIAVPTTSSKRGFDGSALESALRNIGKGLKEGDGVSIECTVPPTTTEKWARNILEEESRLKAEEDFALVFSPERIYEGRALEDLEERYPKIVGGVGPRSTELFSILYSRIAKKGVLKMSSATAAELAKLFEGIYRDVNIALANELAKLCQTLDVGFTEIRGASNSQPFCHLHKPGVGVGGPCIPYYPHFILDAAAERDLPMPLIKVARTINEEMPKYTVSLAQEALKIIGKRFNDVKVAILGLAFRGNIADSRNSPTYDVIDLLEKFNAEMVVHDPFIDRDETLEKKGIKLVKFLEEAVIGASLIIIATDHKEYAEMDLNKIAGMVNKPAAIVDGRNVLKVAQIPRGIYLTGVGRKIIDSLSNYE